MSSISDIVEDWGGFEEFAALLLKNSSNVTVERNVKLYGRSATPRVVDVLIRQQTPPTSETRIIVECKYLNRNVERAEIDALRTVINETQCHKGVILSRVGFQKGTIIAAKELDIDLFTIRDFKDSELSADVSFDTTVLLVHLGFGDISVAAPALSEPPRIVLGPNPTETLISLKDDGLTTLEAYLVKTARDNIDGYLPKGTIFYEGKAVDCALSAIREIKIEAAKDKPIPASFDSQSIVSISSVHALFGIQISQVILSYDELNNFLFRIAVEDCVSKVVYKAFRKQAATVTSFERMSISPSEPKSRGKIIALIMDTFLPFSEFDGLEPGGPSKLDGRSARSSETIASVRKILTGRQY
jgi:Restriction endonuclease